MSIHPTTIQALVETNSTSFAISSLALGTGIYCWQSGEISGKQSGRWGAAPPAEIDPTQDVWEIQKKECYSTTT
jgi:hypothetical protein